MKKFLLLFFTLLLGYALMAQAPYIFNYQGVARNAVGNVLVNKTLTLRLTIHNLSPTGAIVYQETRITNTNPFGLFNVQMGDGNATNVIGSIAAVPWATGTKYIQVEIDPNGGSSFINIGTAQLAAVPYAVSAGTANPVGPAGGSLSGTYPNPIIANGAVTQIMIAPGVTLPPSGPAGGSLTGTYPNPTIANAAVTQPMIAPGVVLPPTGPAGGSLTGNYPNPIIANGAVTSAMLAANVAWVPGGNNLASALSIGTTSNFDLPFITNNGERMRLLTNGNLGIATITPSVKLELGSTTSDNSIAIAMRTSTAVTSFDSTAFSDYKGSIMTNTYPGGLTGHVFNIIASGANSGNWPSNIYFWTRTNGGNNATVKMRLFNNGSLDLGNPDYDGATAFSTRASTDVDAFVPANYANYNGGVIQSTYPGGLTGQTLNIVATGSNSGNWPSNIDFWTRTNSGTNANVKMRLLNNGRLEVGSNATPVGPAILTRAAQSAVSNFTPANYSDYNGGVIQSTYPAGTTGQNLNIAATGSNAGNWPSNIVFFTRTNGGSNASQKMRLWDDGRLELGSTVTDEGVAFAIHTSTSVATFPTANYADFNGGVIQSTYPAGNTGQILNISATGSNTGNWPSGIAFWTRINGGTNASERMRIDDNGFVGIGCTSPNYRLQVVGDIAAQGGTIRAASAVISTTITACSDLRYKKNIAPLEHALENVLQLQGVSYNWRVNEFPDKYFNNKNQVGIIAQELEKIYPELVETDDKGYKTVDYSKMTPVLVEAIKQQQAIIKNQQAEIDALKQDMEKIKKMLSGSK